MSKYTFKPYSPLFPSLFIEEKVRISPCFPFPASIEHVGSTAVPGLGGKGIIDIAIAVRKDCIEEAKCKLQEAGYEFRPSFSTSDRLYFIIYLPDSEEGSRRYHLHLTVLESEDWNGLIGFRDFLRNNSKAMEEYADIKRQAAKIASHDGDQYRKMKEPFFKQDLHRYHLSEKDNYPSPNTLYPIKGVTRTVYLKNIITNPQIIVGDYTYYDDPDDVHNFEKNVLYLFDFMGDKLVIGKFCQIATGARFIMNGSNHALNGFSTYPFKVFGKSWALKDPMHVVSKGDTIIGNDVWMGNNVTIMQGIKIGDGAIIGTNSLVTKDVEPYSIVGGNPAREIRKRFDEETIQLLLALKWWDWDVQKITDNLEVITGGQIDALKHMYSKLLD